MNWEHGAKPCFNSGCQDHDADSQSCKAYTTARAIHKTILKTKQNWECRYPLDRLHSLYTIDENNCWIWRGKVSNGVMPYYPDAFRFEISAIRAIYRQMVGTLNSRDRLKRKCGNLLCVNPSHVERIER